MDINGFKKTKKREEIIKSESDPLIRTMRGDIIAQEKKRGNRKASPPDGLPIVESINESIRDSEFKVQREIKEKAQKEAEVRAEKEAERQKVLREKAEARAKEEAERQKVLREKAEKERIKLQERAQKIAQEKAEEEAERQKVLREKEIKRAKRKERIKEIKAGLVKNTPKLIAGLIIVFLIIGVGIYFYWWNYVRIVPVAITHFECQNEQCVEVEGEGVKQCQLNEDCKLIEPTVPEQLILSDKIETIELPIKEYESFINRLESIYRTKQEDTLKSILIKLIKYTREEYADFDFFVLASKINIPENIRNVIASSNINGDNYNLFLYNNGEENRAGLIIKMGQSPDLVENLKAWEDTITNDIQPLIFKDESLEPATEEFQDNIYKEVSMRYLNFPTSDLSVDYAIIGDKLVITTSKDSMYAIIDALID
ncbi:MAG: hypothetical protein V1901_02990 [Patescibacteria group bacterium]